MAQYSNYPQNVNVPVGVKNRSNFNFDHVNLTTLDFGRIKPVFAREVIPGDSINCEVSLFSRASPLGQPSYTDIKHRMFAFFVPMRLLQSDWPEFINGQSKRNSDGSVSTPLVNQTRKGLMSFLEHFAQATWADETPKYATQVSATDNYDFIHQGKRFVFTRFGQMTYDMYRTFGFDLGTDVLKNVNLSKFIAYQRIYSDWFRPSSYSIDAQSVERFAVTPGHLMGSLTPEFDTILEPRFCCFDKSYFTSAWQTPVGNYIAANNGQKMLDDGSPVSFPTELNPGSDAQYTPSINPGSSISLQALEVLRGVTSWFRRKALAGSRYYENILSQFGIVPDEARLDRTELLGTAEGYVNIGDVTSTSDTNLGIPGQTGGSSLGSYAGKAIFASDGQGDVLNVNYDAKEHGIFMVVSTLLPDCDIVSGTHRENFHTSLNDYFQPELETVGTQAISLAEVVGLPRQISWSGAQPSLYSSQIFGFVPNYAEYKCQRQIVSGNFAIPSLNNFEISNWHTQREMTITELSSDRSKVTSIAEFIGLGDLHELPPHISKDFIEVNEKSRVAFDRIFQVPRANGADHFQGKYMIRSTWSRPMCSLSDALNIDGGRQIQMQYNGIQL